MNHVMMIEGVMVHYVFVSVDGVIDRSRLSLHSDCTSIITYSIPSYLEW